MIDGRGYYRGRHSFFFLLIMLDEVVTRAMVTIVELSVLFCTPMLCMRTGALALACHSN